MDARERLRLYLEQRRDMGESELVLDSMPVDDLLRLIGDKTPPRGADDAGRGAPRVESRATLSQKPRGVPSSAADQHEASAPSVRESAPSNATNWRDALKEIGAEKQPAPRSEPVVKVGASFAAPVGLPEVPAAAGAGIVVGSHHREAVTGPLASLATLDDVARHIGSCTGCSLYSTAKNHVPGEGNPHAGFVVVGEAPGQTEDELGRPFVGRAGDLLTKILDAIQFKREDVFICNVLKHRPPGNRNPAPDEIKACTPYLLRQLELLQPRVILALGTFASQTLLQTTQPIGKLRGLVHRYHGIPLIATYHPAALLRNPAWKRPTWEDVQLARRIFDSAAQG